MGSTTCTVEELKNMENSSAELVAQVKKIPLSVLLLLDIFGIYQQYKRILSKLSLYLSNFSLNKLSRCCKLYDSACVDCLKIIYKHEKDLLKEMSIIRKIPVFGREFQRIAIELEDRTETLFFCINENSNQSINKIIKTIESEKSRVDWQQQLREL
jgi:hypothetical protein